MESGERERVDGEEMEDDHVIVYVMDTWVHKFPKQMNCKYIPLKY